MATPQILLVGPQNTAEINREASLQGLEVGVKGTIAVVSADASTLERLAAAQRRGLNVANVKLEGALELDSASLPQVLALCGQVDLRGLTVVVNTTDAERTPAARALLERCRDADIQVQETPERPPGGRSAD